MTWKVKFETGGIGRARGVALALLVASALGGQGASALAQAPAASPASGAQVAERCASDDEDCVRRTVAMQSLQLALALEQIFVANERAQLEDRIARHAHTHTVLRHQLWMSWMILLLVFAIVGVGLRMSYLQMRQWLETRAEGANSFELGKDGVKLNSPVIGLFIFLISTYFFSVYVDKVYAIVEVSSHPGTAEAKPAARGGAAAASGPS